MSVITFYAESPAKDYQSIEFFFKNLDVFKRYKKQIANRHELASYRIAGTGITGLYIGRLTATIGEMLSLYEAYWKIQKGEDTLYLLHMCGTPLSGSNSCSFWSVKEQKIVTGSFERFFMAYKPLSDLKEKEKKQPARNVKAKAPKELLALYACLKEFDQIFAAQKKNAEEANVR